MSDSIFDDCTAEDCPVHSRNDMEETGEHYAAITYIGEYCVYTDLRAPEDTMESFWNFLTGQNLTWDTIVFRVDDGTVGKAAKTPGSVVYSYVSGASNTAKEVHQDLVAGITEHGIKYVEG